MPSTRIKDIGNEATDPIRSSTYLELDSTASGSQESIINNMLGGSKFHVVTKESDLPTASGGVITLVANDTYLVRKSFSTANSIDLNGSSIVAETNRGIAITYTESSGALFDGDMSGLLGELIFTASGGGTAAVFNLDATASGTGVLKLNRCSFSSNSDIGIIKDYVFLKMESCNFQSNTGGLELEDITVCEIDGEGWYSNNSATSNFVLTGTFQDLKISSGFYDVATTKNQFDFSGVTAVSNGLINGFLMSGAGSLYTGTRPTNVSIEGKGPALTLYSETAKSDARTFSDSTATSNPYTVGSLTPHYIGQKAVNTGSTPKVAWMAVDTAGDAGSWVSVSATS